MGVCKVSCLGTARSLRVQGFVCNMRVLEVQGLGEPEALNPVLVLFRASGLGSFCRRISDVQGLRDVLGFGSRVVTSLGSVLRKPYVKNPTPSLRVQGLK